MPWKIHVSFFEPISTLLRKSKRTPAHTPISIMSDKVDTRVSRPYKDLILFYVQGWPAGLR